MIDPSTKITMLGLDGGVKYVPAYMREDLLKRGWKVIINPKEEYYPQYDRTIQGYSNTSETIEEEDSNYLEVKVV